MDLSWMDDIDMEDILDGDCSLIVETCGADTMRLLWENCSSMSLYISTKPITIAKKRYIQKHYDGTNTKRLARKLEVSEKFVNDALDEKPRTSSQPSLF